MPAKTRAVPATKPRAKAPTTHEQRTLELAAEVTLRGQTYDATAADFTKAQNELREAQQRREVAGDLLGSARAALTDHLRGVK